MASIPMKTDATAAKPGIDQQIAEVLRELALRASVYPKFVYSKHIRQAEADLCTSRMQSVLATLEYMRDNREVIISAVKKSREALAPSEALT